MPRDRSSRTLQGGPVGPGLIIDYPSSNYRRGVASNKRPGDGRALLALTGGYGQSSTWPGCVIQLGSDGAPAPLPELGGGQRGDERPVVFRRSVGVVNDAQVVQVSAQRG